MTEKTRYSDAELAEFKALITQKMEDARADHKHFQSQLDHSDDNGGSTGEGSADLMEDGSSSLSREKLSELAHRQIKFINNLKAALVRIENKSYGICKVTGKLIAKERLKIVPHTTLSIEAKNAQAE